MRKLFRIIIRLFFGLILFSFILVFLYKWIPVKITPLMIIRSIKNYQDGYEIKTKHNWKPIESISKNIQIAVICSEDQNFLKHNGFDFNAIEKAFKNNKKGKKIRGASTISQQTAKNVFLWPNRSWLRKGLEAYFTFLIERFWSKERIMEVYLNSIEMGNGLYGIESASQYWFNKSSSNISTSEAAAIAAILPNPRKYKARPASNYITSRIKWIQNQMRNMGTINYVLKNEK